MGESEWQHASWVSTVGKWAWVIGVLNGLIGILYVVGYSFILWWNPFYWTGQIWNIISSIIGIAISLLIIRPKFSNPCGKEDWDALYGWVLNLGGLRVPWMLIWGILMLPFGWYGWGGIAVLIPTLMLLFAGPKEFKWSEEKVEK